MKKSEKLIDMNWYIISYRDLYSNLVGGQRSAKLYHFLAQKGRSVKLITPVGDPLDSNQIGIANPIGNHKLLSRMFSGLSPLDDTLLWNFRVKKLLTHKKASIIFTAFPPFGACLAGLLLKKNNKNHFWIADFSDSWTTSHIFKPFLYPYKMFFARYFERKLFENADLILLNTGTDCADYQKKYPFAKEKSITIRNGYDLKKVNLCTVTHTESIRFIYAGGVYPKGLAAFGIIHFLEQINQLGKRFYCDFYGDYHSVLDQSEYVNYKGKFKKEELLDFFCKYKIGLIFQEIEDMKGGRINQKFYDYIACGLQPIVLNPSPEIEKQMKHLSIGISVKPDFGVSEIIKDIEHIYTTELAISDENLMPYSRVFQFEKLYQYLTNIDTREAL